MNGIRLIVLGLGLAGFFVAFFVQFRLRYHVSPQRVQELLHTPSQLYPNSIPPRRVLDERGRRLHRIMMAGGVLFIGSILTLLLLQMGLD